MSDVVVDLIAPQGEVLDNTSIPQEYLVRQVIDEFVDHMSLPRYLKGQPVEYTMHWVNRNVVLDPQVTLHDAGIGTGDQLRLVASTDLRDAGAVSGAGLPGETGYANAHDPYIRPPDDAYRGSGYTAPPTGYTQPPDFGAASGYPPGPSSASVPSYSGVDGFAATAVAGATIEVVLSVLDLNRSAPDTLDLDMPIEQLIQDIARRYDLPDRDELNVAATYRMKSKALGRMIAPTETLRSAGVPKHDRLAVLREEIAG